MPRPLSVVADQAFSRAAGAPLIDGNSVRILKDARENYPAWLEAIHSAQKWVHFESYIIHEDVSGKLFAEALMARARAGVRVRVIYDWLGAITATTWMYWERLRRAGVDVRVFNQPRLDSPLGWLSRDHRKMIGVDGDVAFVTGLCVGDMWAGGGRYKGPDPWRDTGVEVRGPAVEAIERAFGDVWAAMGTPLPADEIPDRPGPAAGSIALRVIDTKPSTAGLFRLDQLVAALARRTLWISDAYFVGASPYVQALIAAAEDGVDVRMLVPGGSDLVLVQPMTRAGYRPLLENGVRIFEWRGSMMHAKTAVADGRWARVGSSNLNVQSWLENWELDVAIEDEGFGKQMERMFLDDLQNATEIVIAGNRVRRAEDQRGDPKRAPRPSWTHRTGRTRRAATAGALRLSRTFGAALTARRPLGAAEVWTLLNGTLFLGALGFVGLKWPKGLAYPIGVFCVWVAVSLVIQTVKLWRLRVAATAATKPADRREDAA